MTQIKRLGDLIAVQDEHSHVESATRMSVREVITAGPEREELIATARRVVAELPAENLVTIVADWLEVQMAV